MASSPAAVPTALKPLAMMTKLSQYVSIYEPTSSIPSPSSNAPKLIIVASWMDARDLHIAKYISQYQDLFPTSKILLIKFVFKHIMWEGPGIKAVQPAIPYLQSQISSGYLSPAPSSKPEILIHLFSNGGTATIRRLLQVYGEKTGQVFPLHAAVYDSCPGVYSYWDSHRATMASIPRGLFWRWIFVPLVHMLNLYVLFLETVLRLPSPVTFNSAAHNDPGKVRQTNRTYIYGKGDVMVSWRHIETHAQQAEAAGFTVRKESFKGAHVSHMVSDKERYRKVIAETWKTATGAA